MAGKHILKEVKLIHPSSAWHLQTVDILIQKGQIANIQPDISAEEAQIWAFDNAHVSVGWMDVGAWVGEPGMEYREDLQSISEAAIQGGYTALAIQPNTTPPLQSKSDLTSIQAHASKLPVEVYPIASISKENAGVEMTEMMDMHAGGAVAFSDGHHSIQDSGLMLRALQYSKRFEGLIINQPFDVALAHGGQIHEGATSVSMGIKGIPVLAEKMVVQRDLWLCEYTGAPLHLAGISSADSVELIRTAKAAGLPVSASVPILNLFYTDKSLADFPQNLKVLPPIRTELDREALLTAFLDGTIDLVSSGHLPIDQDAKDQPFDMTAFGASTLEATFSALRTLAPDIPIEKLIQKIAWSPRKLLGIPIPMIEVGQPANLTIFNPELKYTFQNSDIRSKGKNNPFVENTLTGKVLGVIYRDFCHINN